MKEVFVPALGMAMEECLLVEWLHGPGDEVSEGDPVAIIETDKATMELTSPGDGRLGARLVEAGSTIPVATVVCHLLEGDESEPSPTADGAAAATAAAPAPDAAAAAEPSSSAGAAGARDADRGAAPAEDGGRAPHALSPRQRRLRASAGGPVERDARPRQDARGQDRHRAAIGEAVSESWRTMPHFGVTSQILAETLRAAVESARSRAPRLTMTDLLLRAFAHALYEEGFAGEGALGLAVATDRGVAIPVIANVGTLALEELVAAREDAVSRAREGRMAAVDGMSPAFTLSNLGTSDVEYFTGIIPLRQSGLLTLGRAKQRPVVTGGVLAVSTTIFATLNLDHREFDGAHAGRILDAFGRILNDMGRLVRT